MDLAASATRSKCVLVKPTFIPSPFKNLKSPPLNADWHVARFFSLLLNITPLILIKLHKQKHSSQWDYAMALLCSSFSQCVWKDYIRASSWQTRTNTIRLAEYNRNLNDCFVMSTDFKVLFSTNSISFTPQNRLKFCMATIYFILDTNHKEISV